LHNRTICLRLVVTMKPLLCIECHERPIEIKKRQLCTYCYRRLRYRGLLPEIKSHNFGELVQLKIHHEREMEFVKNYFTHSNWIPQPARFRFNNSHYEPDFYDVEKDVWIEVAGSRQRYHAMKPTYDLFRQMFPHLNFEIRKPTGELLNEDSRDKNW